jgi:hypothetical protein
MFCVWWIHAVLCKIFSTSGRRKYSANSAAKNLIQCSLDIHRGCVPSLTTSNENLRIVDAPSLVTSLSEKPFFFLK